MADITGDKFKGANGSKNFRSRERKGRAISLQGAKVPGSETTGERIGQGAKRPGSELARFLLADSLLGANGPGSEKARYGTAESCEQHGRKSTKSIGNQPSRVKS